MIEVEDGIMPTSRTFVRLQWAEPQNGRTMRFNDFAPITIGRNPSNAIKLDSSEVSRDHAYITTSDEHVVVVDRESSNGVYVNGKRVKQQIITTGDSVQIGPYIFHVEFEVVTMRPGVRYVQCPNTQCRRVVPLTKYDCPWCGYNLGNSDTVSAVL